MNADLPLASRSASPSAHRQHTLRDLLAESLGDRVSAAVVGEANSGKTTCIDTLIGWPVLPGRSAADTTFPTIILPWGDTGGLRLAIDGTWCDWRDPSFEIWLWRRHHQVRPRDPSALLEHLHSASAAGIDAAELVVGAEVAGDLALVDTPSLHSRSADAMPEILDLVDHVIVTVPAVSPVSMSLLTFARTHELQQRSVVYVLTKISMVHDAERDTVTEWARRRLASEGLFGPVVALPATPGAVDRVVDPDAPEVHHMRGLLRELAQHRRPRPPEAP